MEIRVNDKEIPEIDVEDLKKKVKEDPKSRRHNNANSRKNLKQYQKPLVPEVIDEEDVDDDVHVQTIIVGRKINPQLIKRLLPQRGVLTAAEKKRYVGIAEQYLADFKREEPTAADIDDIFDIAECEILKTRLLKESKDSPDILVQVMQSLERIYKRKQSAKENLSARRVDRKDSRGSQEITIVDLVVHNDLEQQRLDEKRVADLLAEEEQAAAQLNEVLEKDGY
jgi:hypothetical protein